MSRTKYNQVHPWKGCFADARVCKEVIVRSDEPSSSERVRLSPRDTQSVIISVFTTFALVFKEALDFDKLQSASKELLQRYPFFSGRARADRDHLEIELNNEGFPLTLLESPEGSLDDFPAALCAKKWEGELPARLRAPIIIHDSDPMEALVNDAPMFALRLTTLGKGGGCVLACTLHHILADGIRMMNSLADLSRAYRGESLQPLGRWLHRDLLFKENIHELLPGGKALVQKACDAVKDDPPLPAKTTFRDILEATVAKPGRDMVTWVWPSPPEVPKGPLKLSFVMLHLPKLDLAQLKEDVMAYASNDGMAMQAHMSACNIVVGLLWCLKSICVNAALPGQDGIVLLEVGFVALDIAFNGLKGPAMEGFFGNASTASRLVIPASDRSANGIPDKSAGSTESQSSGQGVPDYSREALLKGIGIIATQHRANIEDWRDPDGSGIRESLKGLCSPQRIHKECAQLKAFLLSGAATCRVVVTSWERFPIKEVVFDEEVGPALHFIPHWNYVADTLCTVVPAMDGSGPLVHMTLPSDKTSTVLEVARTLLPKAAYI